eukprot:Sro195_g083140.1 Has 429 Blast hits to 424 proteins in 112 species Archae - 2 (248) ;mRNA; r:31579-32322
MLDVAQVPHTDRLISAKEDKTSAIVCNFAPVGRSYLPQDVDELVDALICVCEALVVLHKRGVMHRDIRWANVFHTFAVDAEHSGEKVTKADRGRASLFSREWVLFDFEFAAWAPQPPFGAHTLTPGNHAPEMVESEGSGQAQTGQSHDVKVDIWGLGFLLQTANVDIPKSHLSALQNIQADCIQTNPVNRPSALQCIGVLKELQAKPRSSDKDVVQSYLPSEHAKKRPKLIGMAGKDEEANARVHQG